MLISSKTDDLDNLSPVFTSLPASANFFVLSDTLPSEVFLTYVWTKLYKSLPSLNLKSFGSTCSLSLNKPPIKLASFVNKPSVAWLYSILFSFKTLANVVIYSSGFLAKYSAS